VLFNGLFIILLSAVCFSLAITFAAPQIANFVNNPSIVGLLPYMVFYAFPTLAVVLLGSYYIATDRARTLSLVHVVSSGVALINAFVVLYLRPAPDSIILSRIAISAGVFVVLLFPGRRIFDAVPTPDRKLMGQMFYYSIPIGLATLVGTISLQFDKVIVSHFSTPADFAIYVNGAMEVPFISIVTGAISTAILADMSVLCSQKDYTGARVLFHKAAIKSALFLLPLMVILMYNAKALMILFFSARYADSAIPFAIYLLILPARIVYYGPTLIALGKSRLILFRSLVELVLSAGLGLLLVYQFGYMGVAFAGILATYGWSVPYNLREIARGFGVGYGAVLPFQDILIIGALSVAALIPVLLLALLVPDTESLVFLVANGTLYVLAMVALLEKTGYIQLGQMLAWVRRRLS
jgi:O-antigen/teichoic acid export membrane protein